MIVGRLVVIIACAALVTPAAATSYCEVLPTRDGFVALRDAPSPTGKLLRRLKAGEDVQIDSTVPRRGGWIKVFFSGSDRSLMQPGWVNRRLIARECG